MSATAVLSPSCSVALREGTRGEHETAERSGFVELLLAGRLDRAAYADLAAQQLVVYTALGGRRRGGSRTTAASCSTSSRACRRSSRTSPTCTARTGGPRCASCPPRRPTPTGSTQTADSLPRYAAHAYTRYLGDLSGGQIIKRMLQRHYGFTPEGIAFYDFPEIHKLKPFKDVYRERLDALAARRRGPRGRRRGGAARLPAQRGRVRRARRGPRPMSGGGARKRFRFARTGDLMHLSSVCVAPSGMEGR